MPARAGPDHGQPHRPASCCRKSIGAADKNLAFNALNAPAAPGTTIDWRRRCHAPHVLRERPWFAAPATAIRQDAPQKHEARPYVIASAATQSPAVTCELSGRLVRCARNDRSNFVASCFVVHYDRGSLERGPPAERMGAGSAGDSPMHHGRQPRGRSVQTHIIVKSTCINSPASPGTVGRPSRFFRIRTPCTNSQPLQPPGHPRFRQPKPHAFVRRHILGQRSSPAPVFRTKTPCTCCQPIPVSVSARTRAVVAVRPWFA